jgi:hypothetical protein
MLNTVTYEEAVAAISCGRGLELWSIAPTIDPRFGIAKEDFAGVGNLYMHKEYIDSPASTSYDIWDNTYCGRTYGPAVWGYEHKAIDVLCNPYQFYTKEGVQIRVPFSDQSLYYTVEQIEENEPDNFTGETHGAVGATGNKITLICHLYPDKVKESVSNVTIGISYCHLKKGFATTLGLKNLDRVYPGQVIGIVGGSGFSSLPKKDDIQRLGIGGFHTHVGLGGFNDIVDPFEHVDISMLKRSLIGRCNVHHNKHVFPTASVTAWLNKSMCVTTHPGAKMVYDVAITVTGERLKDILHDCNPWGEFEAQSLQKYVTFDVNPAAWRFEVTHRDSWWLGDKRFGLYRYYAVTESGRRTNNFYINLQPKD